MGNFFNPNNAVFTFLGKIFDIIFLSVIFLIFCIPMVTIGPACTALYYAIVKVIRRERGYLFREFLKSFKLNFKQGAMIGVILTVIYIILTIDLIATYSTLGDSFINSVLFGIYIIFSVVILGFSMYVFPVLSRFCLTLKQLVKTVLIMTIKHFPSTVVMIVASAVAVFGVLRIPLLMFIMPALLTFVNSLVMERILKMYTVQEKNSEDDSKKDEWYLE